MDQAGESEIVGTGAFDPAQHGATAKSQPGSDKGFASCQVCHGADFTGGA